MTRTLKVNKQHEQRRRKALTLPFLFVSSNLALRTSDVGNGNHSVSLPIILIKNKFDQMLLSLYISSLLVSFL